MPDRAKRQRRLLVIDDTGANRYAVSRHLKANGYDVIEAATGLAGLDLALQEQPDLIVLDIRLPDISGFDVARRLRADERTADIPILHISASFTDAGSKVRGLDNGADGYLTHPVDPPVMLATVRALLRARSAERAAHALARDWSTTFDAIGEGVCVADPAGMIRQCNRAFRELLGTAEPGPGCTTRITDAIPGVEIVPGPPYLRLPGGADAVRMEVGDRWLRISSVPVAGDQGQAAGVVLVVTDLTRERRADERARLALQLESTGRLAGGVAHEVNNMMTVILANAEFALRGIAADDPRRGEIEGIHRAAARSAEVARQLLTFSRRHVVRPRQVDLHLLIRALEPTIRRLLGADRELRLNLFAESPWVTVDPVGFEQILVNLALNARDAMPHGGELEVRTSNAVLDHVVTDRHPEIAIREGDYVQIDVCDTGLGMDAATLDRVFEPFFTTKDVGEGTGLGLATVYGMVKQAEGYIWVASEPGGGSTFSVQLPQVPAGTGKAARPTPTDASPGLGTIVLIEDEAMLRALLHRALAESGFEVAEAADGAQALDVLQELDGGVTAVVCDVIMPNVGGKELARRMRVRWPAIPILFMSGYTNEEIIRRGLLDPQEAFIQKPFAPGELTAAIRRMLARSAVPNLS